MSRAAGALFALFVAGCAASPPPTSTPRHDSEDAGLPDATAGVASLPDAAPPPLAFSIELQRTTCNWICPAYTVTIRADGSVLYLGDQFVRVHGKASDRISPRDARSLADVFDMASFDALVVPSACPKGIAAGQGPMRLTYTHDGKTRTIEVDMGNQCRPHVLGDLGDAVDRYADVDRWIRCGKGDDRLCRKP